ncbi:MAG: hypothetical protein AAFR81_22535 [Chloroflexota bacterium]
MSDDFNDFSFIWEDDNELKKWVIIKLVREDKVLDYILLDTATSRQFQPKSLDIGMEFAEFMRSKGLTEKEMTPEAYDDFFYEIVKK